MERDLTEVVGRLIYQLAVIIVAAKIAGEVCLRYLRVPPVLGELVAGAIIGPLALGGLVIAGVGPLFPKPEGFGVHSIGVPLSTELYSLAQIGAVVLLFHAGLETNLRQFLRYAAPGLLVAMGGLILPFAVGAWVTVLFGFASGLNDTAALFMGAVLTATSVGITVRVLGDLGKLDTPEGITVVAAAVVDDVLGILILSIVLGMSAIGGVSALALGTVAAKAVGFWVALVLVGLLLARPISRLFQAFRVPGSVISLSLALALLAAGVAESFGLAMIIGAYAIGLAMSDTTLAQRLKEPIDSLYHALVPTFFVSMGMLVDFPAIRGVLLFGAAFTLLATLGKVVGSGLPALVAGFNVVGALRIGVGMLPRAEVALTIAGIGLARGIIDSSLFGACVMMVASTAITAPVLLVPLFEHGGNGRRSGEISARDHVPEASDSNS